VEGACVDAGGELVGEDEVVGGLQLRRGERDGVDVWEGDDGGLDERHLEVMFGVTMDGD
jgi:hypothetical protein